MWTTQDYLNRLVKEYDGCQKQLKKTREEIDSKARELLAELQQITGWECMIKHCYDHYASYKHKDDFFKACIVTHTDDAVQFVKGYSDGSEYDVLTISFKKSLKDQIRDRLDEIEFERRRKETDTRERDLAELERIRKKYGI